MTRILLLTFFLLASANAQTPQPTPLPISRSISIADFGAKGNGTTDDTRAFVAAIAEAAKTGAELRLGDGAYLLKETLRLPNAGHPFSIVGGQNTTLLFAPDHPLDTGIQITDGSGVALSSFTLHGSGAGLDHAISVVGSTNIRLDHLQIESIHGTGVLALSAILLGSDDQVWISNSTISNVGLGPGKTASAIWNYYRIRSQHIYIKHNHFFDNTTSSVIALFDTDHAVVEDNLIDGGNNCVDPCINNGYGILFYRTAVDPAFTTDTPTSLWPTPIDETVIGNQITNTAGSGIYLQGVHGAKVIGNTITKTVLRMDPVSLPAAGIALNGSKDVQILNNTINQSGQGGIALATTQDVLIEGNQVRDSTKCGINLRVAQIRTTIRNNAIDGAPIGLLLERDPISTIVENNVLTRVKQPIIGNMH
jgi:parallel beta-helix repeat protein